MAGKGKNSAAAKREQQRIMLEAENNLLQGQHSQQVNENLPTSPQGKPDFLDNLKFFKNRDTESDYKDNKSQSDPKTATTK